VAEHSAERRDWSPGPFLAHLNRRHPDTVLFLARHLTGDEQQLTDAQLLRVQGTYLLIEVTRTDGSKTLPVPLTVAVASRSELVNQLARILRAAREASPDESLASLELVVSGHNSGGTLARLLGAVTPSRSGPRPAADRTVMGHWEKSRRSPARV
jgi:Domain of unknown function (DUF2470)